ncbi:MAG: response regulator [Acidobacteria bacterium]|nr:response regulator [Acidobacteriota bacterium]
MAENKRILVVDDEAEFCEVLQDILESRGFEVDTAGNGKEALKLMEKVGDDVYSVLIADINMPEMGGIELIRQVAVKYPFVVPVIVTGYADTQAAVESLRVGAYDFISKPFKLDTIYLTVGRALEKHIFLVEKENYRKNLEAEVEARTTDLRRLNTQLIQLQIMARKTRETLELNEKMRHIREYCFSAFHASSFAFLPYDDELKLFRLNTESCAPGLPEKSVFSVNEIKRDEDGMLELNEHLFPGDKGHIAIEIKRERIFGMVYLGFPGDSGFIIDDNTFGLLLSELEVILYNNFLVQHHEDEMRKMFLSSVRTHAYTIEAKDAYTKGHCERVERYTMILARKVISDSDRLFALSVACILHDIGKIGVPETILNKPGKLTVEEKAIMDRHPVIGAEIVKNLYGFKLSPVIRHHHEWFDGNGYPDGLKGEEIPLESRMMAVADTYDAMTSSRPYREGLPPDRAYREIQDFSGRQFDPFVVKIFLECYEEFKQVNTENLGLDLDLALTP